MSYMNRGINQTNPITHDEFMQLFRSGDEFYTLTSSNTKPMGLEGPYKIHSFSTHKFDNKILNTVYIETRYGLRESFVSDLTNKWHGVFITKEAAEACYQERIERFNNDKNWQRIAKEQEDSLRDFFE